MSHLVCSRPDCAGGGTIILIAGGDTYERKPLCENCFVKFNEDPRLADYHIRGGDTNAPVKVSVEDATPIIAAAQAKLSVVADLSPEPASVPVVYYVPATDPVEPTPEPAPPVDAPVG